MVVATQPKNESAEPDLRLPSSAASRRRAWAGRWGLPSLGLVVSLVVTFRSHWYLMSPFAAPVNMDEGYCSALALRMFRGHWLPYVDGVSQRGPILYWLYAIALKLGGTFNWMAVRAMGLLCSILTLVFVFALAARLFSPMAGAVATLVTTYFLTYELQPWDGIGFNGESTAVVFALAAAVLAARLQQDDPPRRGRLLFWIGVLVAMAGLSKQMFLIHGAPIGAWILLGPISKREIGWRERSREVGTLVAGFAVPYALIVGLYGATGHLREFWYYYQRYGREIFMDPLTQDFIRDKVREQIDKYYMGIVAVSVAWFYALGLALRETLAPSGKDAAPAADELPMAPEVHVLLSLAIPGLGLMRTRSHRWLGWAAILVAIGASAGALILSRTQSAAGVTLRVAAVWIAWGLMAAVGTAVIIVRGGYRAQWQGLARVRAKPLLWYALAQMTAAFAGACFTFRFFPHYFVQFFPFAGVVIGALLTRSFEKLDADDRPGLISAFTMIAGATLLLIIANSALHRNVRIRRETDRWYQDPTADPIVRYVVEHTTPEQTIFVWGFRAETYLSSRRYPASRYVYTVYPAGVVPWFQGTHEDEDRRVVPGSRELLLEDLERARPELVIDAGRSMNGRYMYNYPMLRAYLDRHYCFMRYVDGEPVYRRRHGERCPPAEY